MMCRACASAKSRAALRVCRVVVIGSVYWPVPPDLLGWTERKGLDHRTMIRKRSRAREVALQLLFQHELNPGVSRQPTEAFVHERLNDVAAESFALGLFDNVLARRDEIDRLIGE